MTVTAKNSAGESSKSFTLEVKTAEPVVIPPNLTLEGERFVIEEGSSFQTSYSLTGSEPIALTVKATGPDGGVFSSFSVNTSTRTINAKADALYPITYSVTVTAKNSAGESSKSFFLIVTPTPQLTAPN